MLEAGVEPMIFDIDVRLQSVVRPIGNLSETLGATLAGHPEEYKDATNYEKKAALNHKFSREWIICAKDELQGGKGDGSPQRSAPIPTIRRAHQNKNVQNKKRG